MLLVLMLLLLLIPLSIMMIMFGDLTRKEWESDFRREHAHWMRGKCRQNDSFEICARLEATNNIFSLIQLQSSDDYSHTKILQIHTWVCVCVCVSASVSSCLENIKNYNDFQLKKKLKWKILNRVKLYVCVDCQKKKKTTKTTKASKQARKKETKIEMKKEEKN